MSTDTQGNGSTPAERRKLLISSRIKKYFKFSLLFPILLHLAMVVIGAMNFNKCPVEKNIPLYLLSAGILGILTKVVGIARDCIVKYISFDSIMSFIFTLEFIYFLLGSYWVYKEYKPSFNSLDGNSYCDKTTFMFAFIYITFIYVVLAFGLLLLCCCITGVFALDKLVPPESETQESTNLQTQSA